MNVLIMKRDDLIHHFFIDSSQNAPVSHVSFRVGLAYRGWSGRHQLAHIRRVFVLREAFHHGHQVHATGLHELQVRKYAYILANQ